ncbi:peptidase inhibitor family I36 protein [Micromonospora sp. CA-263727]|uniref:peptidase inhibitor family I36 protein n=1 Tax=Micromonospora sp. CA-263727 TaxID=3239967 RepID=UPI003D918288
MLTQALRRCAVVAAALAAVLGFSTVPAQSADVGLLAWECPSGNVCFWSGSNGTGSRCIWNGDDPDWRSGSAICSWSATSPVRSVFNNGRDPAFSGVAYYLNTNYGSRVGCTPQGARGNLTGTYSPRSHQWVKGSCG